MTAVSDIPGHAGRARGRVRARMLDPPAEPTVPPPFTATMDAVYLTKAQHAGPKACNLPEGMA